MKGLNAFLSLLICGAMALFLGQGIATACDLPLTYTCIGVFAGGTIVSLAVQPTGVAMMAVQQEIWVDYIMSNLFKSDGVLQLCYNESNNVLGGSVCHIPQAGAKPAVVKNRGVFPATAVRRTDTDITYSLDVFSTDPTHIANAETLEISYDKMDSVLGEHMSALRESIVDEMIYKWSPSSSTAIIRTSGAAATTALAAGATGTRKTFVKEDLKRAQALMNKQNIPKEDRYALMDSDLLSQLQDDPDLKVRDYGKELDLANGVILKLYGFNIIERSSVVVYDNSATPVAKPPGAASAATDNLSVFCWQKNAIAKAEGTVEFFENTKDPLYYGDVYSTQVKIGGRKRRALGEGVVAIVQTT